MSYKDDKYFLSMPAKKLQKRRVSAPEDRIQVRANTPDSPKRIERWERTLADFGGAPAEILRALIDGYCDCVERDGHAPKLPLHVESKAQLKDAKPAEPKSKK